MDISFKTTVNNDPCRFNYRVAAIVELKGKFLIHRFKGTDFYFLVGGRVKMGEQSADALKREVKEELGYYFMLLRIFSTLRVKSFMN